MIDIEQAWKLVAQHTPRLSAKRCPLAASLGLVLDEDIISPIDSPPHDKSQVDGFAVRCSDVTVAGSVVRVVEEITAGEVPTVALQGGEAARIMTGAPLPEGADAVVMVERTSPAANAAAAEVVCIGEVPRPGQNILRRGTAIRAGDRVLRAGHVIRGIELGLLAELGVASVPTRSRPSVAILSTGNELVSVEQTPGPGQIRNSNGPMLVGLVESAGGCPVELGIGRDVEEDLRERIARGLEADVLILSGGVSAGVLDLVPAVLKQLGVREVFHKVRLKPGKPLWFGVGTRAAAAGLVFGLPGNPVSSLVSFELFVRPALARMMGKEVRWETGKSAQLTQPFRHRGERPTLFPGRLVGGQGRGHVEPLDWRGSADLRTLVDADVLIFFEPGDYELAAGATVPVRRLG